jgi:DNA polymerase I-like protein with 3'-5' exonuclease and polymerase domains
VLNTIDHRLTPLLGTRKAIDTETTGGEFHFGCKPFAVSIKFIDGTELWFEWEVNPMNRQPLIPQEDLDVLERELVDKRHVLVFHNVLYDVAALQSILPHLDWQEILRRSEDTMIEHHVLCSAKSHKLKNIGIDLGIPDDDQQQLKEAVIAARKLAEKLGWKIANEKNVVTVRKKPKSEHADDAFWPMDMWLPRTYILHKQREEPDNPEWQDHPWLTVNERYCGGDTTRTIVADHAFQKQLSKKGHVELYRERMLLPPILHKARNRGIHLRMDVLEDEVEKCKKVARVYRERARLRLGWDELNIGSSRQIQAALYEHFRQPVQTWTDNGNPATNRDALIGVLQNSSPESEVYQFVVELVTSRKHSKAVEYLNAYRRGAVEASPDLWLLYPEVLITGTKSTRFAAFNPNSQNISKGKEAFIKEMKVFDLSLRKVFGPAPGREWWAFDYKQLQLVLFAYMCGEQSAVDAIRKGISFHEFVARKIFEIPDWQEITDAQKTIAKNVNFGFIFGAQPAKIERTAKRKGLWKLLQALFPSAIAFIEQNKHSAVKRGFVETLGGYPLQVPAGKPHAATNYIIQGAEGKIVQRAMVLCDDYLSEYCPDAHIALQVHDELIFDFPVGEGRHHIGTLAWLMEEAARQLGIPCEVDGKYIAEAWNKGESVSFPTLVV